MRKPIEVLRLYTEHNYTLNGAYASRAARNPQREFILFNGKSWSWQSFDEAVECTARLFVSRGVKKGDRVGVMARNCDGHVLVLFALARIGAIMVPVNPEFGVQEAKYVFHHAEVSAVLAAGDTLAVARQATDGLPTPPWYQNRGARRYWVNSEPWSRPRTRCRSAKCSRRRSRHAIGMTFWSC